MAQKLQKNYFTTLRGNVINPGKSGRLFEIATNYTGCFELGMREGTGHWLEGQIVQGEFLFNGRLFVPKVRGTGIIMDNFPKGPTPKGWTKRPRVGGDGYELVSAENVVLFGYDATERICRVTVTLYAQNGDIVAESLPNEFRIYLPPMDIGRGGYVWRG